MPKKLKIKESKEQKVKTKKRYRGGCGAVYFLGFIGAAIYYIGHATTFWQGVLGFLKALVWPVFITLKILGM